MNVEFDTPRQRFKRPGRYRDRDGQPIERVSARLPDALLTKLAAYGNNRNLSMSESIRELLERALSWDR